MKVFRFIALILISASLIVGGVWLSRRADSPPATMSTEAEGDHPDHFFIADDRATGARIECPMRKKTTLAEIWERQLSPCSLVEGWSPPFEWGSMASGPLSRVLVDLDTAAPRALVIRTLTNLDLPPEQQQTVKLTINGQDLGRQEVARIWKSLRFEIPAGVLGAGRNSVSFEFEARISPLEAGRSKDPRTLAAGISELTLLAPTKSWLGGNTQEPPVNVWNAERQAFLVQQSGVLVLPVLIPTGTAAVRFDLSPSRRVDRTTLRVALSAEDLDGGSHHRTELATQPKGKGSHAELAVSDLAGRWALVTIEVAIESGRLEISEMHFLPADAGETDATVPAEPAPSGSRPDIVLITLDAARADRFSFAGHNRKTTPFIDSLARESLVFPSAFALVPYTLCSVPTMITGLSFLDHGVVGREDVLSQDAVTFAESLREAGYHTACFSATPNNSIAKGFDQGYEVFREMWTEGPRKQSIRAHFIAHRVAKWLEATAEDDRPLHLQVHMVPPHAPYDPPADFDLFTDPAYDGPCNGFHKSTLSALDGGSMEPTPECLDHLFDLYDGNLRTADDAVRIIVNALRSRPRWRNTVVLITSDHGEAFMEHGRMEHNSTIFTEMLHVPFILRMPPDYYPSGIDTNRLVTLADITPTLLGAAGLTATETLDGIDLLAPAPEPGGRHVITRTGSARPTLGIRSLRWSMMINAAGSGALFDLTTDTDEQRNIYLEEGTRFAGLGKILTWRVGLPPRLVVATETADITDDERALLETLGYLR